MRIGFLIFVAALAAACGPPKSTLPNVCASRVAGDLVITEFMNDPDGVDDGREYIEIYNATNNTISLDGLTLYQSRVDKTREGKVVLAKGEVAAKGYAVLGASPVDGGSIPSHVTYAFDSDDFGAIGNSSGIIGIRCGTTLVDEVVFELPGKSGAARAFDGRLAPDSISNDDETKWCATTQEYEPGSFGTPQNPNPPCGSGGIITCKDAFTGVSRTAVAPLPGELIVNEVMANPGAVSDSDGEWFEIAARANIDLNGVTFSNQSDAGSTLASPDCIQMNADEFGVLAKKIDAAQNGGLPNVLGTFSFALLSSGGAVSINVGSTLIDTASYGSAKEGVANQLDPNKLDSVLNDDPASFCLATEPTTLDDGGVGDLGTPGASNSTCGGGSVGGTCLDPTTMVTRAPVSPEVGDLVITEVMADPSVVSDLMGEWVEVLIGKDLDLNGVSLSNEGTTGKLTLASPNCLRAAAGTYVLFARSSDSALNGNLPLVISPFSFNLGNTGARSVNLTLQDGGVIDSFAYTGATAGKSKQLTSSDLTAVGNDTPANLCDAKTAYNTKADGGAGDLGTPKAGNTTCP